MIRNDTDRMNQENKNINITELIPVIQEVVSDGGYFRIRGSGWSMLPFIRDNDEIVVTSLKNKDIRVGDLLFYRRSDGTFVIHRVYSIESDETYSFVGDNQREIEKGIHKSQLLFYIREVMKDEKAFDCEKGVMRWIMTYYMFVRIRCPFIAYRLMLPCLNHILNRK